MGAFNYKHLHYFWVVAKTGGVTRASERLHITAQTISGQIALFESVLGVELFARVGRRLELTDAGRVALRYADAIFGLGAQLDDELRHRPHGRLPDFRAGVADVMPKSVAYRLLSPLAHEPAGPPQGRIPEGAARRYSNEPAGPPQGRIPEGAARRYSNEPAGPPPARASKGSKRKSVEPPDHARIVCREGKLDSLLGDLAVHRLDIVLADRPLPANLAVRGYSRLLGECGITFFATAALARRYKGAFPRSLDGAPMLLPGEDSDVRPRLLRWFDKEGIAPRIVGEFDDDALLRAFGEGGAGIFPGPTALARDVQEQHGVVVVGHTRAVTARFYAISGEREPTHPAAVAITSTLPRRLFRKRGR